MSKENDISSNLLNVEENETIRENLGTQVDLLAIGVVQVFTAEAGEDSWQYEFTGVACFVKDWIQRGFFIRVFDFEKIDWGFEEELYQEMIYFASGRILFHTFEGKNCMVGINFADQVESQQFGEMIKERIAKRKGRAKQTKKKQKVEPEETERQDEEEAPMREGKQQTSALKSISKTTELWKSRLSIRKDSRARKSRVDISSPYNFVHVETGLQLKKDEQKIKEFLKCAGLDEDLLDDPQQSKDIYAFVEEYHILEQMDESEKNKKTKKSGNNRKTNETLGRNTTLVQMKNYKQDKSEDIHENSENDRIKRSRGRSSTRSGKMQKKKIPSPPPPNVPSKSKSPLPIPKKHNEPETSGLDSPHLHPNLKSRESSTSPGPQQQSANHFNKPEKKLPQISSQVFDVKNTTIELERDEQPTAPPIRPPKKFSLSSGINKQSELAENHCKNIATDNLKTENILSSTSETDSNSMANKSYSQIENEAAGLPNLPKRPPKPISCKPIEPLNEEGDTNVEYNNVSKFPAKLLRQTTNNSEFVPKLNQETTQSFSEGKTDEDYPTQHQGSKTYNKRDTSPQLPPKRTNSPFEPTNTIKPKMSTLRKQSINNQSEENKIATSLKENISLPSKQFVTSKKNSSAISSCAEHVLLDQNITDRFLAKMAENQVTEARSMFPKLKSVKQESTSSSTKQKNENLFFDDNIKSKPLSQIPLTNDSKPTSFNSIEAKSKLSNIKSNIKPANTETSQVSNIFAKLKPDNKESLSDSLSKQEKTNAINDKSIPKLPPKNNDIKLSESTISPIINAQETKTSASKIKSELYLKDDSLKPTIEARNEKTSPSILKLKLPEPSATTHENDNTLKTSTDTRNDKTSPFKIKLKPLAPAASLHENNATLNPTLLTQKDESSSHAIIKSKASEPTAMLHKKDILPKPLINKPKPSFPNQIQLQDSQSNSCKDARNQVTPIGPLPPPPPPVAMQQKTIQKNESKPIPSPGNNSSSGGRGSLLNDIVKGKALRKVSQDIKSESTQLSAPKSCDGLTASLLNAFVKIKSANIGDEDSEEEEEEDGYETTDSWD